MQLFRPRDGACSGGKGFRRQLAGVLAFGILCAPLSVPPMEADAAGGGVIDYGQAYIDSEGDFVGGEFYYSRLTEPQKQAYQDLLEGVCSLESGFSVPAPSWDDMWAAFEAMYWDHEELWWITGTLSSTGSGAEPEYLVDASQVAAMQAEIDTQAGAILAQCPGGSSYDKSRYVYQWLVDNVDYQAGCYANQCIYSAFVRRQSVCAGYARAAMYLLSRMGVETIYTLGDIGGQSHAWVLIKLGNDWYHMDPTYGDPIVYDGWGNRIPVTDGSNMVWAFLAMDDTAIRQDRTVSEYGYPACTAVDPAASALNPSTPSPFFGKPVSGVQAEPAAEEAADTPVAKGELNVAKIVEAFDTSIGKGDDYVYLKFLAQEDYDEALSDVLPKLVPEAASRLAGKYGIHKAWYSYKRVPEDLSVKVYWSYEDDVRPDVK